METATIQHLLQDENKAVKLKKEKLYPPLESVTSTILTTDATAYYLNRKNQTLRAWACLENGPIRPARINGRLAWYVADILKLLNGGT